MIPVSQISSNCFWVILSFINASKNEQWATTQIFFSGLFKIHCFILLDLCFNSSYVSGLDESHSLISDNCEKSNLVYNSSITDLFSLLLQISECWGYSIKSSKTIQEKEDWKCNISYHFCKKLH